MKQYCGFTIHKRRNGRVDTWWYCAELRAITPRRHIVALLLSDRRARRALGVPTPRWFRRFGEPKHIVLRSDGRLRSQWQGIDDGDVRWLEPDEIRRLHRMIDAYLADEARLMSAAAGMLLYCAAPPRRKRT